LHQNHSKDKAFSCTWSNTGLDRLIGKFQSFLFASFQNHLSDVPAALKEEEIRNLYSWMQKRPKNAIDLSRSSF
jgi:hypothetical protein